MDIMNKKYRLIENGLGQFIIQELKFNASFHLDTGRWCTYSDPCGKISAVHNTLKDANKSIIQLKLRLESERKITENIIKSNEVLRVIDEIN